MNKGLVKLYLEAVWYLSVLLVTLALGILAFNYQPLVGFLYCLLGGIGVVAASLLYLYYIRYDINNYHKDEISKYIRRENYVRKKK